MAWLDDRYWCHPKIVGLTDASYRANTNAITYSSGMSTHGILDPGQQRLVGAQPRHRRELIAAGVWDDLGDGRVIIHDWDEHNGKRDERRAADRERKRRAYWQEKGQEPPQENVVEKPAEKVGRKSGKKGGETRGVAHVEARAGGRLMTGDGSEELPRAVALHVAVQTHPLADEPEVDRTALDQFLETVELREMP